MDANPGTLVSEVTALPNVPQLLTNQNVISRLFELVSATR